MYFPKFLIDTFIMQFRVFWGNLSGNSGKANGIAAALDSEIFVRAGSRRWNLLRGG